ncbi:hypothetical protein [Actinophytocola glycyrrhizae]|uniref:DUF1707 domain-containing protein n=1 Tax=Actinophytocola glycyrrhizae TaxID=2044873 RepID=A0ABV9S8D8_9PSEU
MTMSLRADSNSAPLRSEFEDDFLAGRITAVQYLEHARAVADRTVAAERQQDTAEQKRLDLLSHRLVLLVRVIFLVIAPLAYVSVGVTQISTGASIDIGVLSIVTGAAISAATAAWRRYLRVHKRRG